MHQVLLFFWMDNVSKNVYINSATEKEDYYEKSNQE